MSQPNKPQFNPLNNNPLQKTEPILLRNIEGYIKTTVINPVVAPTYTPKNLNLQFEIRMDLATAPTVKRLYIYSFETKIWSYITLT
jgi:hypothetical protein